METKMYSGLQKLIRALGGPDPIEKTAHMACVSRGTVLRWLREDNTPVSGGVESTNAVGRAIGLAGGPTALGEFLGVSYQAVQSWQRLGYVPARRAQQIEAQYGIPRTDLLSPKLRSSMGIGGDL